MWDESMWDKTVTTSNGTVESAAEIARQYKKLNNEFWGIYETYARNQRLTSQELGVLIMLWRRRRGWTAQVDIQIELAAPKQRVSAIIKKFEKLSYVVLSQSPIDGRNQIIALSEAGKDYARSMVEPVIAMETCAIQSLSSSEATELLDLTGKINAELTLAAKRDERGH